MAQAFADCKSLPKTQSCDSVAQAQAQAIAYAIAYASGEEGALHSTLQHCWALPALWLLLESLQDCPKVPVQACRNFARSPHPLGDLVPDPTLHCACPSCHRAAYAAGSVQGGPGCQGQAQQTASAKATSFAQVGPVRGAGRQAPLGTWQGPCWHTGPLQRR